MTNELKPVKPSKNSTRPYPNEIPVHFTYETKTKVYDDIDVNVFPRKLTRCLRKKGIIRSAILLTSDF